MKQEAHLEKLKMKQQLAKAEVEVYEEAELTMTKLLLVPKLGHTPLTNIETL